MKRTLLISVIAAAATFGALTIGYSVGREDGFRAACEGQVGGEMHTIDGLTLCVPPGIVQKGVL